MTAPLELAKDALGGHLALQVLDRALEPTLADVNFDWLTLYGLDHERLRSLPRRAGGLHSVPEDARRLQPGQCF